jgi:hypothetical protein
MATTYTLIASNTVGSGGASSITFSSIPQTFTDLLLKTSLRGDTTNSDIGITGYQTHYTRINNNLSNLHKSLYLTGNGSSASSGSAGLETVWRATGSTNSSDTSNTFANSELYIPNYTGSSYKSASADMTGENNGTTSGMQLSAFIFQSTAAVTQIDVLASSGNFVQYSTFYLYGISNS